VLQLTARPLTPAAFAPYGQVVESAPAGRAINDGAAWRSEGAPLALDADGGRPTLAVFRVHRRAVQGPWQDLEVHRLGSQTFLPLGGARCLVLVARGGERPELSTLAAFVSRPGQGWTLAPGTWHHALIALAAAGAGARDVEPVDVAVLERAAERVDCDRARLAEPVTVQEPPSG
jgi:ureidoglycolate lyase